MIEEAFDRNFWWLITFLSKFCGKTFLRSETPYRGIGDFISKIESRNWKKICFFRFKIRLSSVCLVKLQQKSEKRKSQKRFFENRAWNPDEEVPEQSFWCAEVFLSKVCQKNFRGRGPQKSMILGLFSKIDPRNFCQLGKNVFFVLPIFSKNRGNGGLFWGVRPNFFFTKTY